MRIITEDNIDQIENMSFSNNIQKLTHNEHLNTKDTIEQVQKDIRVLLRESKGQKFVIEDTDEVIPPPPESPGYQPVTPDMPPPESPDYQPISPDSMHNSTDKESNLESSVESPQYIVGTPEFQPMTPPMSPVTAPENRPRGYFIDTPSDDESSPPIPAKFHSSYENIQRW